MSLQSKERYYINTSINSCKPFPNHYVDTNISRLLCSSTMKLTPAMQQYVDLKSQNPDCLLLFRLGDFYEVFFDDAQLVSEALDIVLTSKNKNAENPIPMAGIPYHSIDKYIARLVDAGHKIAIAEQTSEPVTGQLVTREVVNIVTPGTYVDEHSASTKLICAIIQHETDQWDQFYVAWWDFSLGQYTTSSCVDQRQLDELLQSLTPHEIVYDVDFPHKKHIKELALARWAICSIEERPLHPEKFLLSVMEIQSLQSFGEAVSGGRMIVCSVLFHYLHNTQYTALTNVVSIHRHHETTRVTLDPVTIKNLELLQSSYDAQEKYSLFGVINTTVTAWWERLLRQRIINPLNDMWLIQQRQQDISFFVENKQKAWQVSHQLKQTTDIPRLMTTLIYRKQLASLCVKLRNTLALVCADTTNAKQFTALLMKLWRTSVNQSVVVKIYQKLVETIKDEEYMTDEIDYITNWFDTQIDELRKIAYESDTLLMDYQQELVRHTWLNGIKLKYVKNQWYFMEVSQKDVEQFEKSSIADDDKKQFVRRHTLKTAQRYVTPYLANLETTIIQAKEQLVAKEQHILQELIDYCAGYINELTVFAELLAYADLTSSHALFAMYHKRTKPSIHVDTTGQEIVAGRHPVIEQFLPHDQKFIPNNLTIDRQIHIITGPNMGGKSTFLRQNALIVLLAHAWLYVPAKQAKISLVDGIFARVGSGDLIAKNQSTFMTEMIEVANILHNATDKSFVIFDELGRGTSTYDGLALTKAIIDYMSNHIGAATLLATHYHELISLEEHYPMIKNFSASVHEDDHSKEVVFLKKIREWWADKSYGLDVAKLAWLPSSIIEQARHNLKDLESSSISESTWVWPSRDDQIVPVSSSFDEQQFATIKSLIQSYDVNTMTPMQALQLLDKIKHKIN